MMTSLLYFQQQPVARATWRCREMENKGCLCHSAIKFYVLLHFTPLIQIPKYQSYYQMIVKSLNKLQKYILSI